MTWARFHIPSPWLILDGGFGTSAEELGVPIHGHPLWSSRLLVDEGGMLLNDRIHRAHVDAGAELLIANTHNASYEACLRFGGPSDARTLMETINRAAVESARRSAKGRAAVAGCTMSPDRPYASAATRSVQEMVAAYRPQLEALDEAGVDLIIFEMLSTLEDLQAARRASEFVQTPVAAGLTCRSDATRAGVSLPEAAGLWADRASIMFIQCTDWRDVGGLLPGLVEASPVPVGVYANDGRRYRPNSDGPAWLGPRVSPADYAREARRWLGQGVVAVGGCCGTTAAHVEALAALKSGAA
ncbi:MAG: homocysteine S-methyltransferase family protein [Myxococcota bacterium]